MCGHGFTEPCLAPSCLLLLAGPSEYVQGLTYEECATLLNVDVNNEQLMEDIYETGGWVGGAPLFLFDVALGWLLLAECGCRAAAERHL